MGRSGGHGAPATPQAGPRGGGHVAGPTPHSRCHGDGELPHAGGVNGSRAASRVSRVQHVPIMGICIAAGMHAHLQCCVHAGPVVRRLPLRRQQLPRIPGRPRGGGLATRRLQEGRQRQQLLAREGAQPAPGAAGHAHRSAPFRWEGTATSGNGWHAERLCRWGARRGTP
jgi:hypothetical protein